jgi:RNA polymerase sigma factor (sigma-70 family)
VRSGRSPSADGVPTGELPMSAVPDDGVPDPRAAAKAVLKELLPRIRAQLTRLLGPGPDLDDATQEALLAVHRSLPRFEGRARLTTFVYAITARVAYRHLALRREMRGIVVPLELAPPPLDEADPESTAMAREVLRRLYRCLDRIPDNRRIAFLLVAVEGLTPEEAAEVEGCTVGAIRSRLMHARREIARRMGNDVYVGALLASSEAT